MADADQDWAKRKISNAGKSGGGKAPPFGGGGKAPPFGKKEADKGGEGGDGGGDGKIDALLKGLRDDDRPKLAEWLKKLGDAIDAGDIGKAKSVYNAAPEDEEEGEEHEDGGDEESGGGEQGGEPAA